MVSITEVLGYAAVVGSFLYRTPQILKIIGNQSVEGISFLSVFLEFVSFTLALVYNIRKGYPFFTWGELINVSFQLMVILILMQLFTPHTMKQDLINFFMWIGIVSGLFVFLTPQYFPSKYLVALQFVILPIYLISSLMQIVTIYREKNVANISVMSTFFRMLGSMIKLIIIFFNIHDIYVLIGYIISMVFNTIFFIQVLIYMSREDRESLVGPNKISF